MKCCIECFLDMDIRDRISSHKQIGSCEICESQNVYICDSSFLKDSFESFLDMYTPLSETPIVIEDSDKKLLNEILKFKWNIFALDIDKIQKLIVSICSGKYSSSPKLFNEPVVILEEHDAEYLGKHSILSNTDWEYFVETIKYTNRFHIDYMNLEVLTRLLEYAKKEYKAGQQMFRARYSSESGIILSEMGAPPKELATAGRANSQGVRCLYLSNDIETTFHEIRAKVHDYISVGYFILKKDIEVINLREFHDISPFIIDPNGNLTEYAINKKNLTKISNEIAKPLRRKESELDYLPTQYLSEYIKHLGYDGIEYKSTINSGGYNLALFDENCIECVNVEVYEMTQLDYKYGII